MFYTGVFAALLSPLMMTIGFVIWENDWKGSAFALNVFKCSLGSLLFLMIAAVFGNLDFLSVASYDLNMLVLSSLLGIVIGDNTWLQALQLLGARRVILVDSLKPFLAAILSTFLLGETMSSLALCGMVITIVGVLVVSLDQPKEKNVLNETIDGSDVGRTGSDLDGVELISVSETAIPASVYFDDEGDKSLEAVGANSAFTPSVMKGYGFAVLNVALDSYGSVLTKQFGGNYNSDEINLIRFGSAAVCMGVLAVVGKLVYDYSSYVRLPRMLFTTPISKGDDAGHQFQPLDVQENIINKVIELDGNHLSDSDCSYLSSPAADASDPNNMWFNMPWTAMKSAGWGKVAGGIVFVTFLCPLLSNFALFQMDVGLCLTLTSLGPLYALPVVWVMKAEATSLQACVGTAVAFGGVVILCYSDNASAAHS